MALPSQEVPEEAPGVVLRMDVLGHDRLRPGRRRDRRHLYDLHVARFRQRRYGHAPELGASPTFASSRRRIQPGALPAAPPTSRAVDRLAISLATDDNLRLRLAAYLAQTLNTVQFGARLDLYAAKDVTIIKTFRISVEAYLGFDGLI